MPVRAVRSAVVLAVAVLALLRPSIMASGQAAVDSVQPALPSGQAAIQTPEQFFGFQMGAENKLARWDRIVEYFRVVSAASDRVRYRELGRSTSDNPFLALEISAPSTLADLDRYKGLQRKLYFQGGPPTEAEREAIFRDGKLVIAITCSIHATEVGATQMAVELVHRLATEESPEVQKILDNVIFVLVPSLNPDGQILITDWFNRNLGTPFENSPIPYLYHPYVGHDNNRDMYMFTQKESQLTARLLWSDWFPTVWLDEHQMGSSGARIFVMPATDPINPNVHPLIYRWNGILGQSQAAALEAAGKEGIIYNSTYTNFWQGAMAWSGWWHNQVGLLTEVASARIAAPIEQAMAVPGAPPAAVGRGGRGGGGAGGLLPPPSDTNSRTEYPRPWLGGRWTLRDIVDYELIATMALLESGADRRETLMRHIYEVNRSTVDGAGADRPYAIVIPVASQHDPREAGHLVEKLQLAGIEVSRAAAPFEAAGRPYPAGTFVIPLNQVFARYAVDILEDQTYPEVRRSPTSPPEPPYDVTAWSLGKLLGVEHQVLDGPLPSGVRLDRLDTAPRLPGTVDGSGPRFVFEYRGPDCAAALNALLAQGATASLVASAAKGDPAQVAVSGVSRARMEEIASRYALDVRSEPAAARSRAMAIRAPRIGLYQPFGGGNMDEGWTRWVLEQYGFTYATLHNDDIRKGGLAERLDTIILADQNPQQLRNGSSGATIRPEYRGGLGDQGSAALRTFVESGGTLVTLGAASGFAIDNFAVPVRDLKRGLPRDEHFAPGTIVNIEVDTAHPVGYGMAARAWGFYNNSPFFTLMDGFASQNPTVIARYPNDSVVSSGWLRGGELMAGRAAIISVDVQRGRVVLFGLRPQHRAQTHATFPMLFNALYWSTAAR